jgi:hypothetical protein
MPSNCSAQTCIRLLSPLRQPASDEASWAEFVRQVQRLRQEDSGKRDEP